MYYGKYFAYETQTRGDGKNDGAYAPDNYGFENEAYPMKNDYFHSTMNEKDVCKMVKNEMRYENCNLPLAWATVPFQQSCEPMHTLKKAILAGTIFEELDMPYCKKIIRRR
jgi:hypothetical protein